MRRGGIALAAIVVCAPRAALAATYAVGPGRAFPDLAAVARQLAPGDRVELDGGVTYAGGVILRAEGTKQAPITISGVRVRGARPILAGGVTTLEVRGSHYVIEGLEIQGGSARCLFHHADDVTVRDTVVHDCPKHGILGADDDAGSLTLSYVEVYRAGHGDGAHAIYMATDEGTFPRSVFRMEHCFVHDGTGGNSVKSRAERNEIYSNWIEGALYHELDLIGPDGAEHKHAREDSDVVGNVIRKMGRGYAVRVGGDGTGSSNGRYRFVNNTIVLGSDARAAFRLGDGLESIEMHNNAILRDGGGGVRVMSADEARWAAGRPLVAGSHNWIPMGSTGVPEAWTHTLAGRDPGVVSLGDPRPVAGSPLIGAGVAVPEEPATFAFPMPLASPRAHPPPRALEHVGTAVQRLRGAVDIGAFSYVPGRAPDPPPPAVHRGCGCRSALADLHRGDLFAPALLGIAACARRARPRARRREKP